MRVLYINREKPDYLQDLTYSGLVKLLGAKNIIEYPWNTRYHLNYRPYPKNIGQIKGTFFDSIKALLNKKDFDVVIVASCHPETMKLYMQVINDIPASAKTIFLDGGDGYEIAGDLDRIGNKKIYDKITSIREFDYIFKRECLVDKQYDSNVYSLPFSFNYNHLPKLAKDYKYDVAFWAVESDPIRTKALELIEDKYDCRKNGTTKNQVMKKYKRKGQFYLQELSACKIGLNFRGVGWDTLRFWEIPAVEGFMISQKPQIIIENEFTDGENIVYCKDDLSDLLDLCDYYLKNDEKRKKIAQNSALHLKMFHTDEYRAKKILDTIHV